CGCGHSFFRAVRNGRAVRQGGGTQLGRGRALDLRVEFLDLGFERGDLVVQRAGAGGNRVGFFLRERHTTKCLTPRQNGDEHAERAQRNDQERPRQGKANLAELAEAQRGQRRRGG